SHRPDVPDRLTTGGVTGGGGVEGRRRRRDSPVSHDVLHRMFGSQRPACCATWMLHQRCVLASSVDYPMLCRQMCSPPRVSGLRPFVPDTLPQNFEDAASSKQTPSHRRGCAVSSSKSTRSFTAPLLSAGSYKRSGTRARAAHGISEGSSASCSLPRNPV